MGEIVRELRRKYVEGCRLCQRVKEASGMGPYHDASMTCESGKRLHCSCSICF